MGHSESCVRQRDGDDKTREEKDEFIQQQSARSRISMGEEFIDGNHFADQSKQDEQYSKQVVGGLVRFG